MLRSKRWMLGPCFMAMVLFACRCAFAETQAEGINFQDTYITEPILETIQGLKPEFGVGNDPGWRYDALIQFDLPEAPEGEQVESATLELFNYSLEWANRGDSDFGVKAVMFEWFEEEDMWETIGGGDYGETVYDIVTFTGVENPVGVREDFVPDEWKTWDVTQLVEAWYDGTIDNNGFAVVGMTNFEGGDIGGFPFFRSVDFFDAEFWPRLSIVFDEPGPPGLLADIDGDGTVAFSDFLILSAQFGLSAPLPDPSADIDGDGMVAFSDFLVLSNTFGQTAAVAFGQTGAVQSVPEPSGFSLVVIALLAGTGLWSRPPRSLTLRALG